LILCEVDFDHYRMDDLLKAAKGNPATHSIPFICIDAKDNPVPVVLRSIERAKELGATGFIEAYEWQKRLGEEAAIEYVKMYVSSMSAFPVDKFWYANNTKQGYHFYRT
jgi:hypothetical protein